MPTLGNFDGSSLVSNPLGAINAGLQTGSAIQGVLNQTQAQNSLLGAVGTPQYSQAMQRAQVLAPQYATQVGQAQGINTQAQDRGLDLDTKRKVYGAYQVSTLPDVAHKISYIQGHIAALDPSQAQDEQQILDLYKSGDPDKIAQADQMINGAVQFGQQAGVLGQKTSDLTAMQRNLADYFNEKDPERKAIIGQQLGIGKEGNSADWQVDLDRGIRVNRVTGAVEPLQGNIPEKTPEENIALSPDAIENAATKYNMVGTLPPLGMGKDANKNKILIQNRAAELSKGIAPSEQAIRQLDGKAAASALANTTKIGTQVLQFEETANKNADLALEKSKLIPRTDYPAWNKIEQAYREHTGGENINSFMLANNTLASEYAKIMSGSMGNTAVSDSLRNEAQKQLQTAYSEGNYEDVVATMRTEMANRKESILNSQQLLRERLGNGPNAQAEKGATSTQGALPEGATEEDVKAVMKLGLSRDEAIKQMNQAKQAGHI